MTCSLCILLGFSSDKASVVTTVIVSSTYLFCHDISFFGSLTIYLARSVVLSVLCLDNLMCVYYCDIDNCVTTLFLCSFFKFVSRPSFYVATTFLLFLITTMFSCIVNIPVATRNVCRDRVLSPLNLIACCSFIMMLRHSLLVFVDVFCLDQVFMS